ncbi:MAG: HAMP domain-containing protein [Desulfobulbaceae bacterium]|nr:HAMP domain-containing protein [Desulfobulbaceae bacterium]
MNLIKNRLLWKLLLITVVPVIGVIILVIWLAIDQLAANYFMALMKKYDVSPTDIHQMFLTSIHYYLIWASLAALGLAFLLSFLLTRRVLRPLSQMSNISRDIAAGDFHARVDVVTRDEVGQLGLAFNRMADSLENIEQLRKNMVADVAHELRTPLTNLRGYLEALNDKVIEPSPQTLKMLQEENLRLVHLVESLQQLARADAARAYLKLEKLDPTKELQQVLGLYSAGFLEKNISVTTHLKDGLTVPADRDKLLQALRNLLENSHKYTPANGVVEISVVDRREEVEIRFSNSGPGIDKADLPFIFERFFRAERSRSRDAGGAGIGLSITKELIEAHGGRVGAESSAGTTSVWLTLPT